MLTRLEEQNKEIMKAGLEDYQGRFESHSGRTCLVFCISQQQQQQQQQQHESGGGSTGEVHSLIFQGENPRSRLNWLCLAMTLLKILF
jgi:hypothetical protein